MEAKRYLREIGGQVQEGFVRNRMILSFEEYLDEFARNPRRHARGAAQYLRDAFDHFGSRELPVGPQGAVRHFHLFDRETEIGEGRVFGQEEVQSAIYRVLENFVRGGRVNKLILLHGPNGSAKTTLIAAIARALEDYSRLPEGALYRFNWVFPSEKILKGSIGFGGASEGGELESYAHLDGEALDARLPCDLKDHPLLLIPREERRALLRKHCQPSARGEAGACDFVLADVLLDGSLCHKCRQIYSALLGSYGGDYLKVLRHVQVERFHVSRRFSTAAVTVEPQLSVDADYRQVTADRSHHALPGALQSISLYEPFGPLVSGNRGLVEFSDLLKRPLEAYKYLLGTVENGQVSLGHFVLQLDAVLIASSNEKHLLAFKELPDFASFKGRIELVRVPYLRRVSEERRIYDAQVTRAAVGKHIAPHATQVAALWAVLTRMKKPIGERYPAEVRELVDELSPVEKMRLYDQGEAPDRLSLAQAQLLKKSVNELYRESDSYPNYEGRQGASAREIKTAIFNAAQDAAFRCLTPLAVLAQLEQLIRDKSVYEFLQQEVVDGYHDHQEFLRVAEAELLDAVDDEVRDSMGLVSEKQYRDLFARYMLHVSHWVKGEKIKNDTSGAYERPSEEFMVETEAVVMAEGEERKEFRRSLISAVGAFRLDNPAEGAEAIDYARVFPDLFRRLRDHYYDERKRLLRRNEEKLLAYLGGERGGLDAREQAQVESTLRVMGERYGYCEHCAKDAILFLMRRRYAE